MHFGTTVAVCGPSARAVCVQLLHYDERSYISCNVFGVDGGGYTVRSVVDVVWAWKIEELLNHYAD